MRLFSVAAAALLGLPAVTVADTSLGAGLQECAAITDDAERLSCFDALASTSRGMTAAAPTAPAVPAAPTVETTPAVPAARTVETAPAAPPATPAEPAAPVAVASTAPTDVVPLSDDVGKTSAPGEKSNSPKYATKVSKCTENPQSGQYYFYFDNGQVWKQSKYRKLRWRECEFDVTIEKSAFGYDMYIPEKDRTIRVSRVR